MKRIVLFLAVALLWTVPLAARAATTIPVPDTSQTTTFSASVDEQCSITVPNDVIFVVTDVATQTTTSGVTLSVSDIVLATATKQLKISIQANAASFTPPVALATTWAAGDITWEDSTWTNATGAAGTMSNTAYHELATADADVATCAGTDIVFHLAAKSTVKRSGDHTLDCTWKIESIGI